MKHPGISSSLFGKVCSSAALLLSAVILFANSAVAVPDVNVAYVDLQKALQSSKAGKDAQKKYEKEVKKAQADLDKKKKEFERLKASFLKQRDSLSASARTEKEEELFQHEKELKRSFEDAQQTLRRSNAKIVSALLKDIRKVVAEVGKEEGLTMIFERSGQAVLYADNKIDITDKVVSRYNSQAK